MSSMEFCLFYGGSEMACKHKFEEHVDSQATSKSGSNVRKIMKCKYCSESKNVMIG